MYSFQLGKWGGLGLIALGLIVGTGCRSRKRSEKVGASALKVVISLKNIEDVAKEKIADLTHQISCNGSEWSPGTVADPDKLEAEYFVNGIKVGDTCGVQVIHPNPPVAYEFTEDAGVMYGTPDNIEVTSKVGGQLWAEAMLSKYYTLKSADETGAVKVPVVFKEKPPEDTAGFIAELKCSPEFEVLALGLQDFDASTKRGNFLFEGSLPQGVEYTCQRIQVRKEKIVQYFGDLSTKLSKPAQGALEVAPVELNVVEVNSVQGVVIVTTPGDACKDNEVFDIETRTCKAAP